MKQTFSGNSSSAPLKEFSSMRLSVKSRSAGWSAQTYEECSKLSIFSRLGRFLQLFGQAKEYIIIQLHEVIRISHAVACLKNST